MKKSLLAVAVAAALPTFAQAQSSVTLFGILDASVEYSNDEANSAYGAANTGTPLLAIIKGGTQTGGSTKIFSSVVTVGRSSGSWSQSGNTYNRPTLTAVSQPVEATAATIPSSFFASFASGGASTAATVVLNNAARKYGAVSYQ